MEMVFWDAMPWNILIETMKCCWIMDWITLLCFYGQSVASPVLGTFLLQSKVKNGMRYIKIPGMPYGAVQAFVRFLYSSWYPFRSFIECKHYLSFYFSFAIGFSQFDSLNLGAAMMKKQLTSLFFICSCYHTATRFHR